MLDTKKCCLVVVDVQGKLAELMDDKENLFGNIEILIKTAKALDIPIVFCEQNPKGLGPTIPRLMELLAGCRPVIKFGFSCCTEEEFNEKLHTIAPKQIILCGIETHVCIYQTAMDLIDEEYEVCVVADAVSSRLAANKTTAIDRLNAEGAGIGCTEMVMFELLRSAKHEKFKELTKLVR